MKANFKNLEALQAAHEEAQAQVINAKSMKEEAKKAGDAAKIEEAAKALKRAQAQARKALKALEEAQAGKAQEEAQEGKEGQEGQEGQEEAAAPADMKAERAANKSLAAALRIEGKGLNAAARHLVADIKAAPAKIAVIEAAELKAAEAEAKKAANPADAEAKKAAKEAAKALEEARKACRLTRTHIERLLWLTEAESIEALAPRDIVRVYNTYAEYKEEAKEGRKGHVLQLKRLAPSLWQLEEASAFNVRTLIEAPANRKAAGVAPILAKVGDYYGLKEGSKSKKERISKAKGVGLLRDWKAEEAARAAKAAAAEAKAERCRKIGEALEIAGSKAEKEAAKALVKKAEAKKAEEEKAAKKAEASK